MEYLQRLEIRHVLCPVDFSPISDMALRYAAVAARQFGARLTVLHAERFEFPR
jgi:nucleotide-binding universal stress UspA family protein